ncbi:MAG: anaerobic ribonucleoside-triphosphate reductase activating protein [Oscillospiraceae bacterium]|jgi:anaerobic ribonucleoside-triphosphate reductase activating protein|nr:anaerobic ribonucleoside-triphosphate reductase activating protein [Oscillospiraceae bacterium]MCI1989900.1 anaerobic ribonucleoside-triphosphate reductase activating protein [Oscillospiraceae bacterium]MCI2034618.1 anaerobic ribonucleoside-triphosphate reductase activating protein [Oscillospiraceae bacterium]
MEYSLRISGVEPESIVDGKGFRYVVFTQGCPHNCPGCHNPQTHPFEGGRMADVRGLFAQLCGNPLLKGVTFSGGEPFCQPGPLAELGRMAHGRGLDVTTFTGYRYEDLLEKHDPAVDALLAQTDILIDGPFILAQKDLSLRFRGSRNQRVIDMNETRRKGAVVETELE